MIDPAWQNEDGSLKPLTRVEIVTTLSPEQRAARKLVLDRAYQKRLRDEQRAKKAAAIAKFPHVETVQARQPEPKDLGDDEYLNGRRVGDLRAQMEAEISKFNAIHTAILQRRHARPGIF